MSLERPALAYSVGPGSAPAGIWIVPELTCELPGGLVGYFQRTTRDCLRAAVATACQVAYEQVSIPDMAEVNRHLFLFAAEHCLESEFYPSPADAPSDVLWVALTPPLPEVDGDFHCAVFKGPELFFEPWSFSYTDGQRVRPEGPSLAYSYGYSLLPEQRT